MHASFLFFFQTSVDRKSESYNSHRARTRSRVNFASFNLYTAELLPKKLFHSQHNSKPSEFRSECVCVKRSIENRNIKIPMQCNRQRRTIMKRAAKWRKKQTSSNESQKKIKHSIIIKYKVRRLLITISTNCNYTQWLRFVYHVIECLCVYERVRACVYVFVQRAES